MKKTYINPSIEVVKMETRTIVATSVGIGSTPVDANNAEGRDTEDEW